MGGRSSGALLIRGEPELQQLKWLIGRPLTRDELVGILTDIVHAARSRLSEARTADGLKAAEMLAKMCGWNEPEQVKHDHVHLQVDSALIEQLRAGYGQLAFKGGPISLAGGASGGTHPEREAT